MKTEQIEIALINRIVAEALWHGADPGGGYYQNEEGLVESLNDWIAHRSLYNAYEIQFIDVKLSDKLIVPDVPQIIEKASGAVPR